MAYIVLALLWIGWCALHSALISLTVTDYLKARLGGGYRFYRLFYNVFALATLALVMSYSPPPAGDPLFRWDGPWAYLRLALAAAATALFVAGGRKYDMLQMLGVRQAIAGRTHAALTAAGTLDTTGILGLTRHPWYLGAIILIWAGRGELYAPTLLVNAILTAYVVIGIVLEERKLVAEFGEEYRAYQRRVPMLLPLRNGSRQ